jgi:SnoaL-like domain
MSEPIILLLSKFANCFDLKDWLGLEDTLDSNVECDYGELRGVIKTYSKSEYVTLRKKALTHLKTQHLFSNLEIVIDKLTATCQLNAIIYRLDNDGNQFNSHAIYHFTLISNQDNQWKIAKIKQSILWNEGDPSIHGGVKTNPK